MSAKSTNASPQKSAKERKIENSQRKTKGQELKGKIVSELFRNFHTSHFSEFFPQDLPLQNKGF